ncbi:hypothetical protein [Pseudoalteromonas sp. SR45-4]|uniref:hypothetical protein n=1 Tax=Pseudoalteromonas sp. SR45-4 TaxID=2760929 RepID=UPI0015F8B6B9|nr:hypothetical protein [Pseudoalteromonas sp. SR45-4]MBB1371253.1 hypothetical protein [Pseudoalteromonas sp. SR45-4]
MAIYDNAIEWKFRIGTTDISFPNPAASIAENKRLLSQHFPQLRWTEIYEEDAKLENGCMILPVIVPPVKVNG